jgi:hypothetical protein
MRLTKVIFRLLDGLLEDAGFMSWRSYEQFVNPPNDFNLVFGAWDKDDPASLQAFPLSTPQKTL